MAQKAGKPKPTFSSIIHTRTRNKDQHPGAVDNQNEDGKPRAKRRSPAEMQEFRRQQALDKEKERANSQAAIQAAGAIEDALHREDLARQIPHNRRLEGIPAFRPQLALTSSEPKETEDIQHIDKNPVPAVHRPAPASPCPAEQGLYRNDISGEESGADEYLPTTHPDSDSMDSGEDEMEVAEEEFEVETGGKRKLKAASKKGKSKPGRDDINAVRSTRPPAGTPLTTTSATSIQKSQISEGPPAKRKKGSESEPVGLLPNWQERSRPAAGPVQSSVAVSDDNDSMVKLGGFATDDEADEKERAALTKAPPSKKLNGKKLPNIIKITPGVSLQHPATKKQARGGAARWTLRHLPDGTADMFTKHVTNLAKLKAGTIAPWTALTHVEIQGIVDIVYGEKIYAVEDGDVWCGLVAARISNWRNGFASAAAEGLEHFIEELSEDLYDADQIKDLVGIYLGVKGDPPHCPFWWREWAETDSGKISKKGMFQQPIIMYTLAHAHFVEYDEVPDPAFLNDDDKPIGALILALQAVEHALKSWSTGTYVEAKTTATFFSADNYGDHIETKTRGVGAAAKMVTTTVPRTSRFLKTARDLTSKHWGEIFAAANGFLNVNKKKRRSQSASSRASSELIEDPVVDYTFISDSE